MHNKTNDIPSSRLGSILFISVSTLCMSGVILSIIPFGVGMTCAAICGFIGAAIA